MHPITCSGAQIGRTVLSLSRKSATRDVMLMRRRHLKRLPKEVKRLLLCRRIDGSMLSEIEEAN